MAEYKCYVCEKPVKTGEKFTFTKKGSVHYDCFIADKRNKLGEEKLENLRVLSILLDSNLQNLVNVLGVPADSPELAEIKRQNIQSIEKMAGDITRKIEEL
ncbi:TVG0468499 [Thermoplasma volcanium GSS1]|uniref:TVG0468499 protein n=1 Tax=Thermoplasma volcanium (strain ATCC 51530 / DSM 4299 / JCM 9571 / NBRC 15438 / GSS1) TaxID=273116 RepID=Q97BH5_THEVO|nr:DUF2175 family protein [Thermoplasma volcanium]BAB59622.1 TVG0468499 [Thermoplasma volcanium GSS1]